MYKKTLASVSDLRDAQSTFDDWSESLLDELSDVLPRGKAIKEITPKKRHRIIKGLTDVCIVYLIDALGHPVPSSTQKQMHREEEDKILRRRQDRLSRF